MVFFFFLFFFNFFSPLPLTESSQTHGFEDDFDIPEASRYCGQGFRSQINRARMKSREYEASGGGRREEGRRGWSMEITGIGMKKAKETEARRTAGTGKRGRGRERSEEGEKRENGGRKNEAGTRWWTSVATGNALAPVER
ncbi:predicted protein [Coccidioides posadasii str. Silveira]|uniref:Predicted protein n=1 Tax=Coccidioides posadasii (strain RMSCC 757 / Silveira) TaxID=443226 RepID=E9CX94_COCPS|nr:predicted protein [Coccidioides posadasii str. Silveira]